MQERKLKAFDLFSGIGGFREATKEYCDFVGFCENEPNAIDVYKQNFDVEDEIHIKDVDCLTRTDDVVLPKIDIIFAGFPCQAFSSAGYEQGFNDPRGELFFKLARVIERTMPRFFILENVKRIIHHDSGNTISVIKNTLESLGYNLSISCLDASNFGLPQKRERVFICGFLNNEDFLNFNGISEPSPDNRPVIRDILECEVDACHFLSERALMPVRAIEEKPLKDGICIQKIIPLHRQKAVYHIDGLSPTAREGHGDFIRIRQDDGRIRRLSPREGLRLQGFPDSFTMNGISNTRQYVLIGNAVPVPVVKHVFEEMIYGN